MCPCFCRFGSAAAKKGFTNIQPCVRGGRGRNNESTASVQLTPITFPWHYEAVHWSERRKETQHNKWWEDTSKVEKREERTGVKSRVRERTITAYWIHQFMCQWGRKWMMTVCISEQLALALRSFSQFGCWREILFWINDIKTSVCICVGQKHL